MLCEDCVYSIVVLVQSAHFSCRFQPTLEFRGVAAFRLCLPSLICPLCRLLFVFSVALATIAETSHA